MSKVIKTTIQIGGKVAKSLQTAFKTTKKQTEMLDKAFEVTKKVGVNAFKAVAASVAAIGTSIMASAEATREYRKDLGKMYNNAEMAGVAQKDAWSGLENLYSLSGEFDSANEAMSNLLATGYKGEDLTKVIEAINGATIKWQDTITQESLADAINETVKSGKSVGQFDEILARSGVNLDTFNDGLLTCAGQAERQNYVLTWLAKSGLTEVNAAYQEQNKSVIEAYKADLKYKDAMAQLGEVAEPLATLLKGGIASAISYIAGKLKGINFEKVSSALQKVGELGKKAFDLIWEVLSKIDWESVINAAVSILTVFTNIFNFVVNNWSLISPIIYGIVAALVAYKAIMLISNTVTAISNALKIVGAIKTALMTGATLSQAAATGVATAAQLGLNAAWLASPITWIVLGIMAIVAVFVALWNKCEGFRNFWKDLWEKVKGAFNIAKDAIGAGLNFIKSLLEPILNAVSKLIGLFGKLKEAISNSAIGKAWNWVKGGVSKIWNGITGNALGSTITKPTLTWVGEGGDVETIVPHNNKPRSQALALEAVRGTGVSLGGNTYIFSPAITVQGGNESSIRGILNDEFNKFKAQMEEWSHGQRRLSY